MGSQPHARTPKPEHQGWEDKPTEHMAANIIRDCWEEKKVCYHLGALLRGIAQDHVLEVRRLRIYREKIWVA